MVHHYDVPKPVPKPKPRIMATQVLTQTDLDALEAQRAELDEQIAAVKRSLHGPIPDGALLLEDSAGPYLALRDCAVLQWGLRGYLVTDECNSGNEITLECLEFFCARTRAWREAQT